MRSSPINFGAFVDIGRGIPSFIGMENISVSRIRHPADRFRPGQLIPAVVTAIDRTIRRVFLSHKELLGTWEENAAFFVKNRTYQRQMRKHIGDIAQHIHQHAAGDITGAVNTGGQERQLADDFSQIAGTF